MTVPYPLIRRHFELLLVLLLLGSLSGCAYQTLSGPGHPPQPNADDRLGPIH
jgi:hypothetical protein